MSERTPIAIGVGEIKWIMGYILRVLCVSVVKNLAIVYYFLAARSSPLAAILLYL